VAHHILRPHVCNTLWQRDVRLQLDRLESLSSWSSVDAQNGSASVVVPRRGGLFDMLGQQFYPKFVALNARIQT
jgi:hypothetical protein